MLRDQPGAENTYLPENQSELALLERVSQSESKMAPKKCSNGPHEQRTKKGIRVGSSTPTAMVKEEAHDTDTQVLEPVQVPGSSQLRIFTLNVWGLRAPGKIEELKTFLFDYNVHVGIITETHLPKPEAKGKSKLKDTRLWMRMENIRTKEGF